MHRAFHMVSNRTGGGVISWVLGGDTLSGTLCTVHVTGASNRRVLALQPALAVGAPCCGGRGGETGESTKGYHLLAGARPGRSRQRGATASRR